ncbi:hypothetical protein CDEST_00412 [Colletotrichum destructivum]|uniref:Transcription factor domain-containing protein n=1 Tax=Colletotrichum destructivum TaxID=34406 RepID=A0AAX4HX93_9PEZI|nr:hypothetical protein CDEST_00412 [Colletotrichum destructivum]
MLAPQSGKHALSDFRRFFSNSGLQQIADNLRFQSPDRDDSWTAVPTSEVPSANAGLATEPLAQSSAMSGSESLTQRRKPSPQQKFASPSNRNILTHSQTGQYSSGVSRTDYQKETPGFVPPSDQACRRYLASCVKNCRFAFIREHILNDDVHPALRFAIFALGALYLFEARNAKSMFDFSRAAALQAWTASPEYGGRETSKTVSGHLLAAFLLLSEFVGLDQPVHLVDELQVLGSAISFYARICNDSCEKTSEAIDKSVETCQTSRLVRAYSVCTSALQSFLLGLSEMPRPSEFFLEIPAPTWARVRSDSNTLREPEQLPGYSQNDNMSTLMEEVMLHVESAGRSSNGDFCLSELEPWTTLSLVACTISRLHLARDAVVLGLPTEPLVAEQDRLLKILGFVKSNMSRQASRSWLPSPQQHNTHETHSLVCLAHLRAVFHTDLKYDRDPSQLAVTLRDFRFRADENASHLLLSSVENCLEFLEEPANTGFTYYVRQNASLWGLSSVIWAFESAVFLSKWLDQYRIGTSPVQDGLVERAKHLVTMAWSSVHDDVNLPDEVESDSLPRLTLGFWGRLLGALEAKPFALRLGAALDVLASSHDLPPRT